MILLDTTVLVYAVGADHELRDPCRELIAAVSRGEIEATTTVEVIQEFAHVRARRRGREEAAGIALDYVELLGPLVDVQAEALRQGLRTFAQQPRIGAFDAVLAAVASSRVVHALVSADRAFADLPEITSVYPDAAGVRGLLRA